jgi:hypothetical protein
LIFAIVVQGWRFQQKPILLYDKIVHISDEKIFQISVKTYESFVNEASDAQRKFTI